MKKIYFALVLFVFLTGAARAAVTLTLNPLDTNPSTVDYFNFTVNAGNTSIVDIYTKSLSPVNLSLSLWATTLSGDGTLIGSNDNSTTWSLLKTSNNLDAEWQSVLAAGSYQVTVAGSGITPTGSLLSNGFAGSTTQTFAPYQLKIVGSVSAVPLPAAVWMFGSGLMTFLGLSKRKSQRQSI